MDLMLDADQQDLVSFTRQYLAKEFPREFAREEQADPADLARCAGEQGWPALGLPEDEGGVGGTTVELCLVQEELGRAGALLPLAATIVGGRLPLTAGEAERRDAHLNEILAGERTAAFCALGDTARTEWSDGRAAGERTAEGWSVTGGFDLVAWGTSADLLCVPAELPNAGSAVLLLPRDQQGITVVPTETLAAEPKARVRLTGVAVTAADVVATGAAAERLLDDQKDLAVLLQTAWVVGACETALLLSVEYAQARHQFGRAIATYQAVSQRLADMRIGIDAARLMLWEAAWATATGASDASVLVSVAKAATDDVSRLVMVNAHQVHGALGYSTEYPLQYYTRLIKTAELSLGGAAVHLEHVAAALLDR